MSESLHASNEITVTPRYYRFAVSAFGSFLRNCSVDMTRDGNKLRKEQLKTFEKAAYRPGRYPNVLLGLATALEMRAGAEIQYESFMDEYRDLRLFRGRKPDPWQLVNAERALVHARSMLEFGLLVETAILDGCESLEEAEYVYMEARGLPACTAMALLAKSA